jgi:hypothetical protein
MNDEFEDEEQPLLIRYEGPDTTPLAWVHLDVAGGTQIVPAILRPDLPVTVIASQWAEALGLSQGAGVLAQIATGGDDSAEKWGPCERITPKVSEDLNDAIGTTLSEGFFSVRIFFKRSSSPCSGRRG